MELIENPIIVGFAITNRCNLNCIHCSQESDIDEKDSISTAEAKKIIDELSENKVEYVCFTGGEPLIRKDLFDIANYSLAKNLNIIITTNGTLINEDMIRRELIKFTLVRVSLDSCNEEKHDYFRGAKGSFEKTIQNLKLLKNNGISTALVTTLSKLNIDELDELSKLVDDLGIKDWSISLFSPIGRGMNVKDLMLTPIETKKAFVKLKYIKSQIKADLKIDMPYSVLLKDKNEVSLNRKVFCGAGTNQAVIFPDGQVGPCFDIPIYGGNIKTQTLHDIWNYSKEFKNFRSKNNIKGECGQCEFINPCGGCRALAYVATGDYMGSDPLCWKNYHEGAL